VVSSPRSQQLSDEFAVRIKFALIGGMGIMSVLVLLEMNAKSGSAADITNWLRDGLHHTRGLMAVTVLLSTATRTTPITW